MDLLKRNKKETKVWHWLLVDVLVVAAWFVGRGVKSMLTNQYGAWSWLAYPITYLVLYVLLSILPIFPSGIRSRCRYVTIRTIVIVIAIVVFLGIEIPKMEQNIENATNNFLDSLVSN